jgi:DNA-binding response OmpR family regulator
MGRTVKQIRIFVVDDEPLIATTLAMILRQSGFDVHSFEKPEEALSASRGMVPDLLITDVVMPVLTGIELAIQLRVLCPDCKVLLLSGEPATAELLDAAHIIGHEFEALPKPLHPLEMLDRVGAMLASGAAN